MRNLVFGLLLTIGCGAEHITAAPAPVFYLDDLSFTHEDVPPDSVVDSLVLRVRSGATTPAPGVWLHLRASRGTLSVRRVQADSLGIVGFSWRYRLPSPPVPVSVDACLSESRNTCEGFTTLIGESN